MRAKSLALRRSKGILALIGHREMTAPTGSCAELGGMPDAPSAEPSSVRDDPMPPLRFPTGQLKANIRPKKQDVEKFELNEEGLGIASAAAIASLFDALVLKGVLTGFEARSILRTALVGIEVRQRTECGRQASAFLTRLLERFPKK